MTPLGQILAAEIAATGPMRLDQYMAACLLHPEYGYYATRDPFGQAGDFTTAPEISQMYGEMLGLCLAQAWLDQGSPSPFILAEVGPGRGTLMADVLRAIRAVPNMVDAARVCLVEASATLRDVQRRTLAAHDVTWFDRVAELPQGPLFLIANEFFDALPIRQFERRGDGWADRLVGVKDGALVAGLSTPLPIAALEWRLADTDEGDVVETCPAAVGIVDAIAARIATDGGAALIVDYGDWHSLGDTFQALSHHAPVDPFAAPGDADLTAHVDFEPLSRAAIRAGAQVSGMTTQGVLLERLGITARAQSLARGMAGDALTSHIAAHRRLTHPDEMGQLFKAIAIYPPSAPVPAGFDAPRIDRNDHDT